MHPSTISRRSLLALGLSAAAHATPAATYPAQPVKLVAPTPPAGLIDIVGRLFAEKLAPALGQPVTVDNRPGAAGNIGAAFVAKSPPDGHTLLVGFDGTLVINPWIYPSTGFDTLKDFSPILKLADAGLLLVANPQVPARSLQDLIAGQKAGRSAPLAYATSGVGSTPHICGELLAQRTGLKLQHIPYKGGGQAIADVIAGQVPLCMTVLATATPHIRSGKLVPLGIATERRLPGMPDLPTFQEAGLPGFVMNSWVGMLAPARTPQPVIERLHKEFFLALARNDTRERFQQLGLEPVGNSPQEFASQIRSDLDRYRKVIKAARITVDG
ncbi:MAG TPA: tripartite tricarboxylate transporter substrate binding protein [Ramlibacter sp.]|nr:tripartite tricarboxylate transporter substrate binding protein [Ramlibacter sp.]